MQDEARSYTSICSPHLTQGPAGLLSLAHPGLSMFGQRPLNTPSNRSERKYLLKPAKAAHLLHGRCMVPILIQGCVARRCASPMIHALTSCKNLMGEFGQHPAHSFRTSSAGLLGFQASYSSPHVTPKSVVGSIFLVLHSQITVGKQLACLCLALTQERCSSFCSSA